MSKDQIGMAEELADDLSRCFEEIRAYMARQLGYGALRSLTKGRSDELTEMAEEAVQCWEVAVAASCDVLSPRGELQQLLANYLVTVELCFLLLGGHFISDDAG